MTVAAVITGVAAVGLATAAAAQASWTPITTMTARDWQGNSSVVSVDKAGDFLSAWSGINNKSTDCYSYIQMRIRSHTGRLRPVQTLTPCGPPMFFPAVASAANGDGIVAWIDTKTSGVEARRVSPTGKLGPVITVTPKNYQADSVHVAMSPTGLALVTWDGEPNAARFIATNNALSKVIGLGGGAVTAPAVVFSKHGAATVAWTEQGFAEAVASRITPKGLGRVKVIEGNAAGTVYGVPEIADDSNGDTYLLTTVDASSGSKTIYHLVLRKWSAAGRLGASVQVAKPVDNGMLAVDGAGDAIVTWSNYINSSTSAVYGRHVSHTGKLGPVVRLGTGFAPAVIADSAGAGLVYWQSTPPPGPPGTPTTGNSDTPAKVHGRRVTVTSGAFNGRLTLTSDGGLADAAVSPAGKFAVIWEQSSTPWPVQARFGP